MTEFTQRLPIDVIHNFHSITSDLKHGVRLTDNTFTCSEDHKDTSIHHL